MTTIAAAAAATATIDYSWERYEGRKGWKPIGDDTISQTIEHAFMSGEEEVSVTPGRRAIRVIFADMRTHQSQKVRRVSNKATPDVVYEWDDGGYWTPYNCDESELFRIAEAAGQTSVSIYVGPHDTEYYIDLDSMIQTNSRTGFERNIRSIAATATPAATPAAGTAAPAAASGSSSAAGSAKGIPLSTDDIDVVIDNARKAKIGTDKS